ncbi:unnamed protein product [Vicia faba]|uniref:AIPP2-like SPOC-like domain-containing protein n=1 Tax=Vicia faba TaxID=3906 RepID=A0AAV0ZAF7_VICFA|nr:unnamed protein product [Vicia faba]
MSEEFQNNYRDSGYEKSFNDLMHYDRDHHYAANRCLSNQTPTHYADDDRHLRHRTLTHYSSKRHLTSQRPKHYAEKRHVRHKTPEDYADKKCLPHQTPEDFADRSHSPYQMPEDYAANMGLPYKTPDRYADKRHLLHRTLSRADKRHLPHQTQGDFVDKKCLQHQVIEDFADKRHLPHQKPEYYAANKCLSHKTPDHYADKRNLPQPMWEPCADKRYPPRQTSKHYADKRHLPHQTLEDYADKKCLPQRTPEHYADKRHLPHQEPKDCADKKGLRHPMPKHYADKRNLPQQTPEVYAYKKYLPHQMQEPNIRTPASVRSLQSGAVYCKICDVKFGRTNFQVHNNGRRHQMLLALRELSMKQKTSNGQGGRQTPNSSQVNPIVQPKEVSKFKKIRHSVKSVSCEAPSIRHKEVPAEGSKRKFVDDSGAKDCGLKGENVSHEARSFKQKKVPAESSKRILKDNTDTKDHGFKHEIGGATGGKYMKMNNGIRRPMKSSKPEVNALSNSVKSQVSEITPPSGRLASPKIAPVLVKGSSFKVQPQHVSGSLTQKSKGKEHHKVQITTMEKNDQSHSTPVELNASAVGSSFEPPIQIDSQLEIKGNEHHEVQMSESKVQNEIQNHIVHPNDQQPSISIELQDPGSMTNNHTEVVNSDSAANEIVLEPLASAPPDASMSNFEPQTEHDLHTEIEPQVLDAVAYHQSQHPSEISGETETADENSQAEVEMEIIQLPQVSVCLKCGNKGFEETLVYCNRCEYYALHRYCLDGPVVFTDEVIWFCEDCEAEVVDEDYPDSEILDSENGEVDSIEDCDLGTTNSEKGGEVDSNEGYDQDTTNCEVDSRYGCSISVDPLPITDPVWRGSLQLINRSFELMSHLSTLACPKVLEETGHLPNVFHADLLQRSAVWPQSFRKYGTNNQSIGLYFFPENERVERYFDQLVYEMISNDLAIRATVEEAELLIFSSTMLPSQYRRFQSKYYLWGMFRRKQTLS